MMLRLLRTTSSATLLVLAIMAVPAASSQSRSPTAATLDRSTANTPWLFAGFRHDSKDGVYYALSVDGYHWKLANGGKPVVRPTQADELMRDPFLQRAPDGSLRMVWTWSWNKPLVIGYAESTDLVTWTPHRQLPVMAIHPDALNVWAPALYYEPTQRRWLIFWASTIPGSFPGDTSGDGNLNHRIYSTTTKDFNSFTPAKIFFDPGFSVIDATLLPPTHPTDPFTLIFKDERKTPLEKHLLTATGPGYEGPWSSLSQPISEPWSEGAAIVPVADGYLAYYDHYSQGQHYGAVFSPDLVHWTDALSRIDFPAGMRHGSFLRITQAEYDRLSALAPAVPAAHKALP